MARERPRWRYEADETPKRKHHWNREEAGFVRVGSTLVGKCPAGLTLSVAEQLINDGIEFRPPGWSRAYPQRIYVVHEGVVYRATPTNPGSSYHGFPERGSELRRLPRSIWNRILERAETLGCSEAVKRWMQQ